MTRRASDAVIAAALGVQIVVPLTYYLGDDRLDERFAWRMFSTVHQRECRLAVEERFEEGPAAGTHRFQPDELVTPAWIVLLRRGDPRAVEGILRARCELGAAEVSLIEGCRGPDGTVEAPTVVTRDCVSGARRERSP